MSQLVEQYWFVPLLAIAIPVAGKVVVALFTTWGEDGKAKAEILREVGDMFRIGQLRNRRKQGAP